MCYTAPLLVPYLTFTICRTPLLSINLLLPAPRVDQFMSIDTLLLTPAQHSGGCCDSRHFLLFMLTS
jgi:hypothetical protein